MRFLKQKPKHRKKDNYLHVMHSTCAGKTRSFQLHRYIPIIICSAFALTIVSLTGLGFYCHHLNQQLAKAERVNSTSRAIRGEVEALTSKIHNIELTMGKLKSLSSTIKKSTGRSDDRNMYAQNKPMDDYNGEDTLGIGPLSKEDYEISKQLTGIKQDHLELKSLFEEANLSQLESTQDLEKFTTLIADLKKYNQKLQLVPDVAPTRGHLSSTYGWRLSPFSGKGRMHLGLDIAAPLGSPIYATADGVVVRTAIKEDYGRMLEIQHSDKLLTRYGHTSMIYVKEGQHVKKGEIIAAVGSTGRSTGPHVHYEIEVDGKRTDPKNYIVLW